MVSKTLLPLALASALVASVVTPGTATANPGHTVTECTPYQPYPGHQQCTQYFYDDSGELLFTTVYYIDETGMWYLLP